MNNIHPGVMNVPQQNIYNPPQQQNINRQWGRDARVNARQQQYQNQYNNYNAQIYQPQVRNTGRTFNFNQSVRGGLNNVFQSI
jgi:hypothetical protein